MQAALRAVETTRPAPWLGGRRSGVALETFAPGRLFTLPVGVRTTVHALDGTYVVRALGEPTVLGELPLELARPAIRRALIEFGRDDAFDGWIARRENAMLDHLNCAHDQLPQVASIDLTDYLRFLSVAG